ncbi:MAG: hypothetical protein ACUVQ6_04125 [Dissulfurimicrobium sp.]|uniref:hypothetical protein n=1 Tax=Dissulfurimicrobium sp. TaxID=2022436 RepID=UPI00404983AA
MRIKNVICCIVFSVSIALFSFAAFAGQITEKDITSAQQKWADAFLSQLGSSLLTAIQPLRWVIIISQTPRPARRSRLNTPLGIKDGRLLINLHHSSLPYTPAHY